MSRMRPGDLTIAARCSLDIDSSTPAFARRTNSIEPGGMTRREMIIRDRLAFERGFAGFDSVGVSPELDARTGSTSTLATRLMVE